MATPAIAAPTSVPVIPPDNESIYASLTSLSTSNPTAYQAIVRPTNPPNGIGGFLFDIPGDEEIRLRSQITSYFLEDNTPVQDNLALEPMKITLRGMVAELALGIPTNGPAATIANPLPLQPAMQPGMTDSQQQAYAAQQAATAQANQQGQDAAAQAGTSQSLYQYYQANNGTNASVTKQTAAFLYFKALWSGQQLISVETPWGIVNNCAILDMRVVQSEKSKYVSDFTITFQEFRFAGEATITAGNLAGRTALQLAPTTQDGNAGQTAPTAGQISTLYSIFGPTTPTLTNTPTSN